MFLATTQTFGCPQMVALKICCCSSTMNCFLTVWASNSDEWQRFGNKGAVRGAASCSVSSGNQRNWSASDVRTAAETLKSNSIPRCLRVCCYILNNFVQNVYRACAYKWSGSEDGPDLILLTVFYSDFHVAFFKWSHLTVTVGWVHNSLTGGATF